MKRVPLVEFFARNGSKAYDLYAEEWSVFHFFGFSCMLLSNLAIGIQ